MSICHARLDDCICHAVFVMHKIGPEKVSKRVCFVCADIYARKHTYIHTYIPVTAGAYYVLHRRRVPEAEWAVRVYTHICMYLSTHDFIEGGCYVLHRKRVPFAE